jgi:hypothetical protein
VEKEALLIPTQLSEVRHCENDKKAKAKHGEGSGGQTTTYSNSGEKLENNKPCGYPHQCLEVILMSLQRVQEQLDAKSVACID